jgi:hypothetical protein
MNYTYFAARFDDDAAVVDQPAVSLHRGAVGSLGAP